MQSQSYVILVHHNN